MEIKQEINQIVNALPDNVLGEVLQYLKQVEKASLEKINVSASLKTIIKEDRELLERLAK